MHLGIPTNSLALLLITGGCSPTFALAKQVDVQLADIPLAAASGIELDAPPATRDGVKLDALLGNPVMLAGKRQTAYMKIGLEGLERQSDVSRPPVNVGIVLDRSSSMAGDKIREAKRAAIMAVNALDARDIVSVVTYSSTVDVIVPATRVTDKQAITATIATIEEGGSTALFAGVSRGAAEVRKFLDKTRISRVILLSDGLANIGPSSPGELAQLGISLAREGMSVTTIGLGLGYNEDLMTQLAMASDGNHAFVENATELARIFELEFGDVLSIVAQDVELDIELAKGVKPVRVLGRDAVIDGQRVTTRVGQVLAGHEKYLLVDVEVPPLPAGSKQHVADVSVSYDNLATHERNSASRRVSVTASRSPALVDKKANQAILVAAVEMLANEQNKLAVALRDEGKVDAAKQVLQENVEYLRNQNVKLRSKRIERLEQFNRQNRDNLEGSEWNRSRKQMREVQMEMQTQRSY